MPRRRLGLARAVARNLGARAPQQTSNVAAATAARLREGVVASPRALVVVQHRAVRVGGEHLLAGGERHARHLGLEFEVRG
jgi:hypothetical protein